MHFQALLVLVVVTVCYGASISTDNDQLPGVVEFVKKDSRLKALAMAFEVLGITEEADEQITLTVFAPSDDAFSKVPPEDVEYFSDPKNREELGRLIGYHGVPNKVLTASDLQGMSLPAKLETFTGDSITVTRQNNQIKINDANIVTADIRAKNGVIHIIDRYLDPDQKAN